MSKYKIEHLNKGTVFGIITIGFLLGTLPLLVHEVQNPTTQQVQAATLALKQFPGLDWSQPSQEYVSVLLDEKTPKERLVLATGEKSAAISTTNLSKEILAYYQVQLLDKGFKQIKVVGDPKKDKYWVTDYRKGLQYAEIEFYPTPYKTDSFTIVLFFGVLPKDS